MKKMELKDCIPSKPIFKIKSRPGKEFAIRAPNMADQAWFIEQFNSLHGAQAVIADRKWAEICRIVYRLMDDSSRREFLAEVSQGVDDSGVAYERTELGWQVLLKNLSGIEEASSMMAALTRAIMNSNPIIEKAITDEVKKSLKSMQSQTGRK